MCCRANMPGAAGIAVPVLLLLFVSLAVLPGCSNDTNKVVEEPTPSCVVDPTFLSFGEVPVGETVNLTFTIYNTGTNTFEVDINEVCPDFLIEGLRHFVLEEEDSATITVVFQPQSEGEKFCGVQTGVSTCDEVPCTGKGVPPAVAR